MSYVKHKNRPLKYTQAQQLRQSGSVVERTFRNALRDSAKSYGVKFRYQYPLDPYVVDFVCLTARLVIEIDGQSHDSAVNYDERRRRFLEQQGFEIRRFANADIMKNAPSIAESICEHASGLQKVRWLKTPPRNSPSRISTLPQGEGKKLLSASPQREGKK